MVMMTILSPETEGYLTESTDRNAQTYGLFFNPTVQFASLLLRKGSVGVVKTVSW